MLVHRRSLPHNLLSFPKNLPVPIAREALWEFGVLPKNNTVSLAWAWTWTAWSGDKLTSHETTALPTVHSLEIICIKQEATMAVCCTIQNKKGTFTETLGLWHGLDWIMFRRQSCYLKCLWHIITYYSYIQCYSSFWGVWELTCSRHLLRILPFEIREHCWHWIKYFITVTKVIVYCVFDLLKPAFLITLFFDIIFIAYRQ